MQSNQDDPHYKQTSDSSRKAIQVTDLATPTSMHCMSASLIS